jgi:hypothetical protein
MIRDARREERVAMTFGQRNAWVSAFVMPTAAIAYLAVVLPRLRDRPAAEVSWVGPMLWAIGATVIGTIAGIILISIAAAIANRGVLESKEDVRDKQIDRYGDRLAQAITADPGHQSDPHPSVRQWRDDPGRSGRARRCHPADGHRH